MPRTRKPPLPFNKDLGGRVRVTRAFARKCWSWGLPVWQDAGRGASRLGPPQAVPPQQPGPAFDAACLGAEPWIGQRYGACTRAFKDGSTYLLPSGRLALHFRFRDGSNPFVKYGEPVELLPEVWAWSRRYDMFPEAGASDRVACYGLSEKCPGMGGLFAPGP